MAGDGFGVSGSEAERTRLSRGTVVGKSCCLPPASSSSSFPTGLLGGTSNEAPMGQAAGDLMLESADDVSSNGPATEIYTSQSAVIFQSGSILLH
jgi:hypothetical protein